MQLENNNLHMDSTRDSIHDMTKMAICVAFCCVTAYISFPLPFTPGMVTALTMALGVSAFVLTPRQTFLVLLTYILLGSAGLPVFVGGTAGLGRLFGPTGGFIIAWMIAYPLVSLFKGDRISFRRYALANILIGIPITYLGGLISMLLLLDVNLWQAMTMAVFPFIPGDIMKALMAALLGTKINQALRNWI